MGSCTSGSLLHAPRSDHRAAAAAATASDPLLSVEGLSVSYERDGIRETPVRNVSLALRQGEILGVVGESGSGKSQMCLALLGLLGKSAQVAGSARLSDRELVGLGDQEFMGIRGAELGMIFQDPGRALDPLTRIGTYFVDVLRCKRGIDAGSARQEAQRLLADVGLPDPKRLLACYPHQLSGGMKQRVTIALALAGNPKILIADEPTTALDVTMQTQILELLCSIRDRFQTAILLVTHDLGVVAEVCDSVAVMYAGEVVERASVWSLFDSPRHPYTQALLNALPRVDRTVGTLQVIEGAMPHPREIVSGCMFAPRCQAAHERCHVEAPPRTRIGDQAETACWRPFLVSSGTQ